MSGGNDANGPDPGKSADLAEFIALLGELRIRSGNPSLRTLAGRVGPLLKPPQPVTHSTISDVFRADRRRLDLDLVVAIVRALGLDERAVSQWRAACVTVHAQTRTGGPTGVLRQLPADLATFTGRQPDLDRLVELALSARPEAPAAVVISAIEGMAGVGKTQLAVRLGHQLVRSGRYADAQLYVNLRGFDTERAPVDPSAVLGCFLRALGVPGQSVPEDMDERAAMFRDRLHGKETLVLLDNAADEDQVRPLIPAGAGCLVVITCRRSLAGLDGVIPHRLGVFSRSEAVDLLARIAGQERVRAEEEAATRVVEACGLLPLAVALAAARLRARPAWTVADLAAHLSDGGLAAVSAGGGRTVHPVFDLSYRSLPDPVRRVFRLLGLYPGDDVTPLAIAALAGLTQRDARDILEYLQDEYLVQQNTPGRYELHDLLRLYAVEKLTEEESADARAAALERALVWLLHTADRAVQACAPHTLPIPLPAPAHDMQLEDFADPDRARDWCEAELPNLVAATHAAAEQCLDDLAWRLPKVLRPYFDHHTLWDPWHATHSTGLASARRLGDAAAQAHMNNGLGGLAWQRRDLRGAAQLHARALTLFREAGDQRGEISALNNLGTDFAVDGDFERAEPIFQECLALARAIGDPVHENVALNNLAGCASKVGNLPDALRFLGQALDLAKVRGNKRSEARALHNLGETHHQLDDLPAAARCLKDSLAQWREIHEPYHTASSLLALGKVHRDAGNVEPARQAWTEAHDVFEALGVPEAAKVLILLSALGEPPSAPATDHDLHG